MTKNIAAILLFIVFLAVFGAYYWADSVPGISEIIENREAGTGLADGDPARPTVTTEEARYVSASAAVLGGTVSPRGVQTAYWYEYGTTDALGSSSAPELIGSGYLSYQAPATVSGLVPDTRYFYRLIAENQHGKAYGTVETFTTSADSPAMQYLEPSVETEDATNVTVVSATINGQINPRGFETRYWFEYGETVALGNTTSSAVAGTGTAKVLVSANLRGLEADTAYYYRLNSQNAYGTVNGNIFVFKTPAENSAPAASLPVSITGPTAGVGRTIATMQGKVDPNGIPTTYRFKYGKSAEFGLFELDQSTEVGDAGSGTEFVDVSADLRGLQSGARYYYQLVSENQNGVTGGSIHSFTTLKP